MSLILINQAVVEMSQNWVVTSRRWKFQKSCVGPSVRIGRRTGVSLAGLNIGPAGPAEFGFDIANWFNGVAERKSFTNWSYFLLSIRQLTKVNLLLMNPLRCFANES